MKISFKGNVGGALRQIDAIVDSLKDVDKMLGKFGKHMRHKVQETFDQEGPGWTQRAAGDQQKRAKTKAKGVARAVDQAQKKFAGKLRREYTRALRSGNPVRAAARKRVYEALQKLNAGEDIGAPPKLTAEQKTAVQNRQKLVKQIKLFGLKDGKERLQHYDRVHRKDLEAAGETRARTSIAKLGERLERAGAGGKILGRLASSMYAKVKSGTLEVGSKIPWAAVHNSGGTAGHGAKIPMREFLRLDNEDMDVLAAIVEEQVAAAAEAKKTK